jgi:hypothetical protein
METEKKQWTKPELIVLVRSKPEEAVLVACKTAEGGGDVTTTVNICVWACSTPCVYGGYS